MQTRFLSTLATHTCAVVAIFAVTSLGIGCSETESDPINEVTPTPTATPDEDHGPPHSIMEVGSTEAGGGMITINEVSLAYVVASSCLGGTGDECTGGTVAYTGDSPGFNDVRSEDPNLPLYKFPDGVEVSIEITEVDADASVLISGTVLDSVGETAVINTSPELHNHPTWQIVAPGGAAVEDKSISFRLHADGYESSEEITVTLSLFEEDDDHEDDEDDDGDDDEDD